MKKIYPLSLSALLLINTLPAFASVDCDLETEKQDIAHCVAAAGPEGTNKFIQFVADIQGSQFAATMCARADHELYVIPKNQKNSLPSGVPFVQCNDVVCNEQKPLGVDNFTIKPDNTYDPYKFTITLDPSVGASCNDIEGAESLIMTDVSPSCKKATYCVTPQASSNVSRFIKVVQNNNTATTYCINPNTRAIYKVWGESHNEEIDKLTFYQCDDVKCTHSKFLDKDTVKVVGKKTDHNNFTITLDPAFGQNCTPYVGKLQ